MISALLAQQGSLLAQSSGLAVLHSVQWCEGGGLLSPAQQAQLFASGEAASVAAAAMPRPRCEEGPHAARSWRTLSAVAAVFLERLIHEQPGGDAARLAAAEEEAARRGALDAASAALWAHVRSGDASEISSLVTLVKLCSSFEFAEGRQISATGCVESESSALAPLSRSESCRERLPAG